MPITLRPPTSADIEAVGRIIHDAFGSIADQHNFPRDFPSPEVGIHFARMLIGGGQSFFGVIAEIDGRVVGSNFLDERDAIRSVGPITVAPSEQSKGIGRRLMEAVIERGRDSRGIRLVQDAFNTASMSLYASLGFEAREPLALMRGKLSAQHTSADARLLDPSDLDACADLCRRVHGFDRRNELRDAIRDMHPFVLLRNGHVAAYASAPSFWFLNHGVAEAEQDMKDLLLAANAASAEPLALLMPIRQASLFRWCLKQGMRVIKPLTLMTMGDYHDPRGTFFPSVEY